MKNAIGFIIPLILAAVVYFTKPSNQECIDQVTSHYIGSNIVSSLISGSGAGAEIYQVEDCIFWKTITNRITGNTVGVGAFGKVFYN